MFNALKYTKSLEENGFDRDQAESLVSTLMQMLEFNMVSKSDIANLGINEKFDRVNEQFERVNEQFEQVSERFEQVNEKFKQQESKMFELFAAQDQKMDYKLKNLEFKLMIKLGIMLAISVGLLSTIISLKM